MIVLVLAVAGFAAAFSIGFRESKCSCPTGVLLSPSSTRATPSEAQLEATTWSGDTCAC